MAKFNGIVGFVKNVESPVDSGVWVEEITERAYHGDVLRDYPQWDQGEGVHDNFNLNHKFSIIADAFAKENYGYMRFVTYGGFKWLIKSAEVSYPRINIYVGGVYNG